MHNKCIEMAVVIFSLVLSAGCAASLSPMEVSEGFWKGIRENDVTAVSSYVTTDSREFLEKQDLASAILPVREFNLGRTTIEGERAWIDTTVEIAGDRPFHMSLQTVLQQENRKWKVDYNATVATIRHDSDMGRTLSDISALSRQFADKLNQSLDQVQKALPQIEKEIGRLESDLKQRLPELRQHMEELAKQLEQALGNKGQQPPDMPPPPPPHTREI